MDRSIRTLGKTAVATGVATAFLAFAFLTARPSEAGSPYRQDAAKVEVKVEVKKDMPVVGEKAAEKVGDAVPPAPPAPRPAAPVIRIMPALPAAPAKAVVPGAPAVQEKAEAKRAAVAVPLMMPVAPAANAEAMAKQLGQQFQPILRAELRFLTSACQPSTTQRREIALEGGKALKQAATKLAEVQLGLNQLGRVNNNFPDPRKMIRDAIEAAAKAKLSPEQLARYQKELERRAKDYREVTVLNLVANLDKLLILSTEQREKVCESLLTNWDERTYPTLENLTMYEGYYPIIPDQHLNSILTEEQRRIWRGAQKLNFGSIRNYNFFNNGMVNGGDEEDEDVKAAMAEEVKK